MKVKFLKDHAGFEVGEVVWWADAKEAEKLAKKGIVELIEDELAEPKDEPGKAK